MADQAVSGTQEIGQTSSRSDGVLWAIMGLAAVLLFWGLGDRTLWEDEAETALLGKNVLRLRTAGCVRRPQRRIAGGK